MSTRETQGPQDDTSEFVAVRFAFNATAVSYLKSLDVAKWDKAANAWVMPRTDWEMQLSDDINLPQEIRDHAFPNDWKDVLAATDILRAATTEPRDAMPKYQYVGGRTRFVQVRP